MSRNSFFSFSSSRFVSPVNGKREIYSNFDRTNFNDENHVVHKPNMFGKKVNDWWKMRIINFIGVAPQHPIRAMLTIIVFTTKCIEEIVYPFKGPFLPLCHRFSTFLSLLPRSAM